MAVAASATGDIHNNVRKLKTELKEIRFDKEINYEECVVKMLFHVPLC
mgnify:CR=1 FL=1